MGFNPVDERFLAPRIPAPAQPGTSARMATALPRAFTGSCDFTLDGDIVLHRSGDPLYARCIIRKMPVIVNKKTVGLIYADSDRAETLSFKTEELSLLKTLRNQAVLAIRQKT